MKQQRRPSYQHQDHGLRRRLELFIAHNETFPLDSPEVTSSIPSSPSPPPSMSPLYQPTNPYIAPAPPQPAPPAGTSCLSPVCWIRHYPVLLAIAGILAAITFCCCYFCSVARNDIAADRIKYRRITEDVDDAFTDALDDEDDFEGYENDMIEMNDLDGGNLTLEEVNG